VSKTKMTVLTRSRMAITLTLVSLILLETHPMTLAQNDASDEPHGAACEREILKVGPHGRRFGEKSRLQ
jgi:hypothetical protein